MWKWEKRLHAFDTYLFWAWVIPLIKQGLQYRTRGSLRAQGMTTLLIKSLVGQYLNHQLNISNASRITHPNQVAAACNCLLPLFQICYSYIWQDGENVTSRGQVHIPLGPGSRRNSSLICSLWTSGWTSSREEAPLFELSVLCFSFLQMELGRERACFGATSPSALQAER